MGKARLDSDGNIFGGQFAHQDPPASEIPAGSVIKGGNFAQHTPDTPIMVGRALTILGGNWENVRKDAAWTINGGRWTQRPWCTNLRPNAIAHGLTPCAENCSHSEAHTLEGEDSETITVYTYAEERLDA